ncbi:unnamed protein product [Prunus armeniaca]|uniref:IQ domain-containing protein IQM3 n=1 Tax=Prunus armeniaca TaxID=36596 RepID=A0A6J5WCL4_PRUAR|nr:unnamed protein product [Prunus armeniaca]
MAELSLDCYDGASTVMVPQQHTGHGHESTAAVKLQKVYRSYRTRRRLADSAVVAEELWLVPLRFRSSIIVNLKPQLHGGVGSAYLHPRHLGKGLSKDAKAQKLAFQHWIEAIDPRHRYGHNLNYYYDEWCRGDAGQPFFYWLDVGDGKEVDLKDCPRSKLQQECIKYLGPQEREHFEYIICEGTLVHKGTGHLLDTNQGMEDSKWIFVMSTSKKLYAGEKKKGLFHHSSFLAGGATLAAGRLRAEHGKLKSVSAYSGHYRPTNENLGSFLTFLKESGVALDGVQVLSPMEDNESYGLSKSIQPGRTYGQTKAENPELHASRVKESNQQSESCTFSETKRISSYQRTISRNLFNLRTSVPKKEILQRINSKKEASSCQLGDQLSLKWSTGAGPRIGSVADYPLKLRLQALEFVSLSPKVSLTASPSEPPSGLTSFTTSCRIM